MKNLNWEKDRRLELGDLQNLLQMMSSLNHGSNFMSKLEQCIHLSEKLQKFDLDENRPSFIEFLIKEATKEK